MPAAVFLSYASQDAEAARRICDALRAAGIEVWFDQSELRGGDVWDRTIRQQIRDCTLFVPIVSQNTQERLEGYFRLEWRLAVERSHLMAIERPFLVPVVVDGTRDREAVVPDAFMAVQWTRVPAGGTPPAFVEHVRRLLSPEPFRGTATIRRAASAASGTAAVGGQAVRASRRLRPALLAIVAVAVLALAYLVIQKIWSPKHRPMSEPVTSAVPEAALRATSAAFAPPPHSIAVLPFVNMSGDREQDYFSDGLSEELLNSLARIDEFQVAARTSSFYFKGEHADLATIAHKLNVASVLEGSVRRSGHTVRVTAQLNNAVTGYHLWSQSYDRDLGDVLKLQTDIANAVANALKVTLLHDVASKIEQGGTRNPAAFDAYLRASSAYRHFGPVNLAAGGLNEEGLQSAIAAYTEAIRADPDYALAYAGRSLAFGDFARALVAGPEVSGYLIKAQTDARRAIALAPDLADSHLALANFFAGSLELTDAFKEYEHALALAPGNARLLEEYAAFAVLLGRTEASLATARRLLVLDPLNSMNHFGLGVSLLFARRYGEAIRAFADAKALTPEDVSVNMWLGISYYLSGDFVRARAACEGAGDVNGPWCLAMVYDKLGQHTEAEAMLAKVRATAGDRFAEGYADIYAQWGDTARALDWLETAMRNRDPYLAYTKVNFFFDPLRKEPRFQAIERALKFPD
jgi:TolB-like protein/cytochrome c-type biogenesis protein CcmH/NrfG